MNKTLVLRLSISWKRFFTIRFYFSFPTNVRVFVCSLGPQVSFYLFFVSSSFFWLRQNVQRPFWPNVRRTCMNAVQLLTVKILLEIYGHFISAMHVSQSCLNIYCYKFCMVVWLTKCPLLVAGSVCVCVCVLIEGGNCFNLCIAFLFRNMM